MTSQSLIEKLESAKRTLKIEISSFGEEYQSVYNSGLDKAIAIVRQHEAEQPLMPEGNLGVTTFKGNLWGDACTRKDEGIQSRCASEGVSSPVNQAHVYSPPRKHHLEYEAQLLSDSASDEEQSVDCRAKYEKWKADKINAMAEKAQVDAPPGVHSTIWCYDEGGLGYEIFLAGRNSSPEQEIIDPDAAITVIEKFFRPKYNEEMMSASEMHMIRHVIKKLDEQFVLTRRR